jgi:hypothetical protein
MAKRPSKCTVCSHREHAAIDLGLARGVSVRALAKRYRLGSDSIYRHSRAHLPPQLRATLIAGPSTTGNSIMGPLLNVRRDAATKEN